MHKINKLSLILLLATIPALAGYADTQLEVKGFAPHSRACSGIENQPFGINLSMPGSQFDLPKINSTQGFEFSTPKRLAINNEGVEDACDYYLSPTDIAVRGQKLNLYRLLINSKATGSACVDVQVYLSITTVTGSDCEVKLTR